MPEIASTTHTASSRFVILHHTHKDGEHWDLMIEQGGVLLTWQLQSDPMAAFRAVAWPVRADRIADHRLAYLDYEGPISGDRGHVRRIDAGAVVVDENARTRIAMTLDGSRISGRFVLERNGEHWTLSPA